MAETYNDINLKSLVFNKVTNEEYRQMVQNGTIKDDEFYITPSELIDVPNIDSTTSGKYLTNDGTGALWSDVQSTNIAQDLTNPSADTVPSTKAVSDESSRITTLMNTKISNCITYIPQDIKLELNNGTLTLKAGSKVYVPNGFESDGTTKKFDIIILNSDQTFSTGFNGNKVALFYGGHQRMSLDRIFSGDTMPSTTTNDNIWYDTSSNKIKTYKTSSSSWIPFETCSLPIGLATANTNGTGFTSIDQVFNGFGYIGSTLFALPGVKGLIPNGRNADGSLKNIELVNDRVLTNTYTDSRTATIVLRASDGISAYIDTIYDEDNNITKNTLGNNQDACHCGKVVYSSGKVTSFTPKTVFHALDYNESRRLESVINNKVNKTGDTMTGNLIIKGNIPAYILQDIALDLSKTFTDNRNDVFFLERDKNGKDGCFINFRHDIYDGNVAEICASNGVDNNRKIQGMGIWVRKNGEYGTYSPKCSFDNSIVTTVSHGDNWIRFGNGLQICWGKCSPAEQTVTLPQPFKDTNYVVNMTLGPDEIDRRNDFCAVISNIITTSFRKGDRGQLWIAIGYWY